MNVRKNAMIDARTKEFELSPTGPAAKWFFAGIALLPVLILLFVWLANPSEFAQAPVWLWILIVVIGPAILLLSMKGMRNPHAKLSADGLKIRVSFVNKTWPLSSMDRSAAKIVDLENSNELKPRWKLVGAAMPGLKSGWFKLKNGETAHIYLTTMHKIVYIPTHKGSILLSLERPAEFLEHLKTL
jgi:Bacterial PH domain